MRRPRPAWGLLLILLVWGATELAADFRAGFREGVRAVERRQWQRAVEHLEEAIAHHPTSGETVLLYGRRFVRYLPYWYLGLAKYHLGDHQGAAEAWQRELDQGAIQGDASLFADLQRMWPEVEGTLARESTPPLPDPIPAAGLAAATAEAEGALQRAAQAAGALGGVTGRPGFDQALAADSALRRDLEQAEERLRQARQRLQQGRAAGDLAALRAATSLAEEAHQGYQALLPRARQGLEAVEVARRQQEESRREAEERRLAEQRRRGEAETRETETREAPMPLRQEVAALEAEARGGPPADLINAARAYFSADYERAMELLRSVEAFEARARVQAHLFRAASGFTLYHLSQGPESDLLDQVRREIQALLALDPAFRPDPELFSPRFLRFFAETAG